jgi:hypothetical protein
MNADQKEQEIEKMRPFTFALLMLIVSSICAFGQQPQESFDDCSRRVQGTEKLRVSSGVIQGLILKQALPDAADLRSIRNSDVKVKLLIDQTGTVQCAAGIDGEPSLYDRSAKAAKEWKFRPYLLNGNPVILESALYFHYHKGKATTKF